MLILNISDCGPFEGEVYDAKSATQLLSGFPL